MHMLTCENRGAIERLLAQAAEPVPAPTAYLRLINKFGLIRPRE